MDRTDRTPKVEMFVAQPAVHAELWRTRYQVTSALYRNGAWVFGPDDAAAEVEPNGMTPPDVPAPMG